MTFRRSSAGSAGLAGLVILGALALVTPACAQFEWFGDRGSFPDAASLVLYDDAETAALTRRSRSIERWRVFDAWGETVGTGEAVGRAAIEIAPSELGPGYYEVQIERRGQNEIAAFAVLPAAVRDAPAASAFGVMTHFAHDWSTDVIPLIGAAGITRVRDELYWNKIERRRGRYAIPRRWRAYLRALEAEGVDPLLVLSFANSLYDQGYTPHTAEGAAAFARYAAAVLEANPGRFSAVEVWNEVNGSFCDGPCRDDPAGVYARLLAATFRAVRAAAPEVTVAGGAAVLVPLGYYDELFAAGGLDDLDVVVVHPYGQTFETIGPTIEALRAVMAAHGEVKPIWATEYGLHPDGEPDRLETAADLVRMLTSMRAAGVERVYWYLLRDYDAFVGMGLLLGPDSALGGYAPAPAYPAFAHLNARLGALEHSCRAGLDPRTYVHRFGAGEEAVWVAWTADDHADLNITAATPLELRDMFGGLIERIEPGASALVRIDQEPAYVIGDLSYLAETRADRVAADSLLDFAWVQGEAGWSYGAERDGAWSPAELDADQYGPLWSFPGSAYAFLNRAKQHPTSRGEVVRRWTSDIDGPARLAFTAGASGEGDGVAVRLSADGEMLETRRLGGDADRQLETVIDVTLEPGDVVEAAVGAGPGRNDSYDSTGIRLTVLQPGVVSYIDTECR